MTSRNLLDIFIIFIYEITSTTILDKISYLLRQIIIIIELVGCQQINFNI